MQKYIIVLVSFLISCSNREEEVGYYENGNLKYKVNIFDGKREGDLMKYFEDGTLMLESHWKDGEKHGTSVQYYHNGNIEVEEPYKDGVVNGKVKMYDSLGNLRQEIMIKGGKRNGENVEYFKNGRTKLIEHYSNDLLDGKVIVFKDNGLPKYRFIYNKGTNVYAIEYLDKGVINQFMKLDETYDASNTNRVGEKQIIYVKLLYSYYNNSKLRIDIGNFDSLGNLVDTTYSILSDSLTAQVEYVPKKEGENTLKGLASEIVNDSVKVVMHMDLKLDIKGK